MYEMWERHVLYRPCDCPGIPSQVCALLFTSSAFPTTSVILIFYSSRRPASFVGQIFNFPIP
jgi:hypothetical protein